MAVDTLMLVSVLEDMRCCWFTFVWRSVCPPLSCMVWVVGSCWKWHVYTNIVELATCYLQSCNQLCQCNYVSMATFPFQHETNNPTMFDGGGHANNIQGNIHFTSKWVARLLFVPSTDVSSAAHWLHHFSGTEFCRYHYFCKVARNTWVHHKNA